jgi:nitronate monooxygenase
MIRTRLTAKLGIEHPILLAPMAMVAGGELAAAVSAAGGLGLIGGGYGDGEWLQAQFAAAGNQPVGAGFITWSLARQPELLDLCLARSPKVMMFGFGDATGFVAKCKEVGVTTLWQVQRLDQARQAIAAGTDILVAQGQEAGGHGMERGLTTLLPAVRDLAGDDRIVVAAGGIGDGRGLAASLMLGADGVMMGTRFFAAAEALGPASAKARLVKASGDETVRTQVFDLARGFDWPTGFTGRVLHNDFSQRWHRDTDGLRARINRERARYEAVAADDFATRVVHAGEVVDLITSVKPAAEIVAETVAAAARLLESAPARYLSS